MRLINPRTTWFIVPCLQSTNIWPVSSVMQHFQDLHNDLSSALHPGNTMRLSSVTSPPASVHFPAYMHVGSRLLIKVCCSVHRRNETLKFWHLWERSFVSFWGAASFFSSHASPQYCHACRCSQDDYRGRPVSLPQFFRWLFIDAASPSSFWVFWQKHTSNSSLPHRQSFVSNFILYIYAVCTYTCTLLENL